MDVLQTLLKCFMKPLSKIMKENDFHTIFLGIKVIIQIDIEFFIIFIYYFTIIVMFLGVI